jgi:uncharacterized phage-like protein YoqJ
MILAGTGHRPEKFFLPTHSGYADDNPLRAWIKREAARHIRALRPLYVISGMADGFDLDLASVCVEIGQPFIAAIPFEGQERRWPARTQQRYRALREKAYEVVVVCEGPYTRDAMLMRNMWMVDHCNVLLAAFDGTPGGTAHTVNYANRMQREIARINPSDYRARMTA